MLRPTSWVLRRLTATYVAGFFLAVAGAPHRHLDPAADLFSDGPSDSGVLAEAPACPGGGSLLGSLRLVDDDPCLACFHRDFDSAAVPAFVLSSPSTCLALIDPPSGPAIPEANAQSPASRSPPAAA